jgi:hypothetical protein
MTTKVWVAALAIATVPCAWANDSTAALGAGGITLTQSADIRMASEDLFVSREEIRVKYSFVNESGAPITTRVAFPLPEADLEALTETDVGWQTDDMDNVLDFHVAVDGRAVSPVLERKAFLKGVDVTDVLTRLGVPVSPKANEVIAAVNALPKAKKQELRTRKLIDGTEDWTQLLWVVKNTYHWQQTFPADRPLKVEHRYKPVVGGHFIAPEPLADEGYRRMFCIDEPTRKGIETRMRQQNKKNQSTILVASVIEYVLTTGKNWKGPIGLFTLTLTKERADNIISFCMDGVKKTGPTTFVVEKRDFEPESDLKVLIVGAPSD